MRLSSIGLTVVATSSIFLGLAYIFVLTRLYVRHFIVKKVDLDDLFLILTLVVFPSPHLKTAANRVQATFTCYVGFVCNIAGILLFNYGVGPSAALHQYIGDLIKATKYYYLAELFYIITAALLRVSVALLLLRIASTRPMRITIYAVMGLMVAFSTAFLFIAISQCSPVQFYWDWVPDTPGTCSSQKILADTGYAHSAISFVADWTLALIPIWLLWNVQISRRRKFGIAVLLSFGLL